MKKMLACLLSFTILASTLTGCTVGASNATATAAENQAPAETQASNEPAQAADPSVKTYNFVYGLYDKYKVCLLYTSDAADEL